MFGTSVFVSVAIMIVFGLLLPFAVAAWWIKTRKESVTTVLLGAATWFVFALILESVPKAILLNPALPVGKAVTENAALYVVVGALLAGLFEETGRFIVFKTLLRSRTNRETGVSHGIGHGGFEALFTLTFAGIQNVVYIVLIQTGRFQTIIDQAAEKGVDISAMQALPQQLMALTPGAACLSAAERIFAMLLHVGLSVLVFYAVRRARPLWFVLAIFLHALFDVPPALYQSGILKSLYVCETVIAVYAVVFFAVIYAVLYKKDEVPRQSYAADP